MGLLPIKPILIPRNNWKMLVVKRDDLPLPKGWITAIVPAGHVFSDYERTCGIWEILDVDKRPYPIKSAGVIGVDGLPVMTEKPLWMVKDGRPVRIEEKAVDVVAANLLSDKVSALPIPAHLDRSHSTVWDYGPGRTYSTPQAAYDALYASVGGTGPWTETHYIRGWSGTYGVVGRDVLFFDPAVLPDSREHLLICDVETGETVIWDGSGGDVLDGNAVSHVRIRDITFGNTTFGLTTMAYGAASSCSDWKIERCEGDGTLGSMTYSIMFFGVLDGAITDCYCHDISSTGVGAFIGNNNSVAGPYGVVVSGNRFEADYGFYIGGGAQTVSLFNNTLQGSVTCFRQSGGTDMVLAALVNNIYYATGNGDCIDGIQDKKNARFILSDGNCYHPSGTGVVLVTGTGNCVALTDLQSEFGIDANSIEADPLLNADLTLQAGSPCLTSGVCVDFEGYNGVERASGFIDIGAEQLTEPPTTTYSPAFDGIENDGDGDAVTLTITPSALGDYDLTRVFYRVYGSGTAWTDGGTYVGTQGVQGTKQITGLDDSTRYEFIIFAETGNVNSEPSITRSVYCTDSSSEGFVRDIAYVIESEGFGVYATNLFINDEPDMPNDCITVYSSGGGAPDVGANLYRPTVMVRIRGGVNKYQETFEIANNILVALHGTSPTVNGSRYLGIWATSDVMRVGRDENNRVLFSVNFRMIRTPV